jgi:hypothetical protein
MFRKLTSLIAFALVLAAVQPGMGADPDPSLMAWWAFDGDALDSSGNGRHGTFVGTPQFVPGVFGEALEQDGDDYVTIEGYKGILGTNPFSIVAWIRTTNTAIGQITHWGTHVNGQRVEFRVNSNRLRISGGGGNVQGATDLTDGEWHHVAVTVIENASASSGDVTFYVDGQEDTIASTASVTWDIVANPTLDVTIGWRPTQQDRPFLGNIDEVGIYARVLTQEEVQAIILSGGGEPFPFALSPDPADGALLKATWVNLFWSPGAFAVSHDAYVGESFDEVSDGTGDAFVGNQTETTLIVGFPGFRFPGGLVPGTTYYWRIDEVNETDPNSPWKGDVWSFSVPPRTAYAPVPADRAESVALDAELSWAPGFEAKLHAVHFGGNFDDVNSATGGLLGGDAFFTPSGPLELAKTYYWRVDEFDPPTTHKGAVWSFRTEGTAADPIPAKGLVDVSPTPLLKWTAANLAASHEVYFGADADAVANAGKGSPEYKGAKALDEEIYGAGRLDLLTTYYWRVDEVNDTQPGSPWIGNVWSFTTGDFLVVDDFESYNDIDPPDPASNRIFDKWIDGFGTLTNGALVGNDLPPYAEQSTVHGGAQSMIYRYDNTGKTSEATLTLVYPRDWTEEGVTKLSLWIRGGFANAADRVYVALNGTAVVYHADPAATQIGRWSEWVIDLATFGIDLTNVNSIILGIGTKDTPAPTGGTGQMFFDDIRLYR